MPGCTSSKATSAAEPAATPEPVAPPAPAAPPSAPPSAPPAAAAAAVNGSKMSEGKTVKIAVIYYSTYGHVAQLAKKVKEGVDAVPGVEGVLYQVKETLSPEILAKIHAPPQPSDIPFIDAKTLTEFDGFIFGFPTRYGSPAAQFKTFWDSTGGLWQSGALAGKPFGLFTSTATLGGGQEITLQNALSNFVHHGMIYIPVGYTFGAALFGLDAVRGGSAFGAGTFAGADGSRQPTQVELDHAVHQGKYTAGFIKKLAA